MPIKDELEIIKNLVIPLAILHGEDDALINLDYIKGLEIPTLWENEVQKISGSGYSPQFENPNEFYNLFNSFIEETINQNLPLEYLF